MKLAEISHIFKKNDNFCKENYTSTNILTIISKLLENIMSDQITEYFSDLPKSSLKSGFRGGAPPPTPPPPKIVLVTIL